MNEQMTMIVDSLDRLLTDLAAMAPEASERWQMVEEMGVCDLLLDEEQGGMGAGWVDAEPALRLLGARAVALPIGETMIARRLLSLAALPVPSGPIALATVRQPEIAPERVIALGAWLRTAQIGGALAAALNLTIDYAKVRSQFGRELRKFQAIQQQIALLAEEVAATASASASAAAALDRGPGSFAIACAKLRANQAAGAGALIAHQVHGAIGITAEYSLHRFTNALWQCRSDFGNDRYWAQWIGRRVLAQEAGTPWSILTKESLV
jgi:acyl-CoA dehydrogenase